ncbi:GNAT family N-acetyltransferase [Mycobacterium deserti]|uniref:GNAT family N-acetyltransferase n=1 Tax=Mycobacterium deserti TaxID=2978347 RepID=UPI0036F2A22B
MEDSPLFCSTELARRIECAERQLIDAATEAARLRSGAASFVLPVAGGAACFAEAGSPMNKVVGLGFGGVPDDEALSEIEQAYTTRETPVQVELANLGEPAVASAFTRRGYQLVSYENVLGRSLSGDPQPVAPPGVEVRACDDLSAWLDVVVEGFAHPDDQGVVSHEDFPREIVERAERDMEKAGATPYLAYCDGEVAGGAGMRVADGVAQLTGAATAPAYRRRGVQTALLSARLSDAAGAGCDIAVVTTQPGSKSQQNVQRRGFHLLYTRAILVK